MAKKWKVKLINGAWVVGRESKTSHANNEFVLPIFGSKIFKSKKAAEKRANNLNK